MRISKIKIDDLVDADDEAKIIEIFNEFEIVIADNEFVEVEAEDDTILYRLLKSRQDVKEYKDHVFMGLERIRNRERELNMGKNEG